MFYVVMFRKRTTLLREERIYGILDTSDLVVETYTGEEILDDIRYKVKLENLAEGSRFVRSFELGKSLGIGLYFSNLKTLKYESREILHFNTIPVDETFALRDANNHDILKVFSVNGHTGIEYASCNCLWIAKLNELYMLRFTVAFTLKTTPLSYAFAVNVFLDKDFRLLYVLEEQSALDDKHIKYIREDNYKITGDLLSRLVMGYGLKL